ncbi:hypothetical protein DFQ28_002107 [Apophysomyces sp. BC1034]|nr:hypothetical protein DFQ30_010338 [Apophysomyces sp. BC1015]KAG0183538.1 hypothetical protein DFQ29_002593 [Apophysomyces sp. BC1021]KAG0193998.1 hypothetical protein DFQ28_002107 [Apophysomyces sp. BC1034]
MTTSFKATEILDDTSELHHAFFGTAQGNLQRALAEFVNVFEVNQQHTQEKDKEGTIEALADKYVQLSGCHEQMSLASQTQHEWSEAAKTADEIRQELEATHAGLVQHESRTSRFADERAQFLADIQKRRREHEQQVQKQQDRLDEHYAKKTRESIYCNLVGI